MFRVLSIGILTLVGLLAEAGSGQAQVFVRAPFVRVFVGPGGGVYVRAPFVNYSNMWVPGPPATVEPPAAADEELHAPRPLPKKLPAPQQNAGKAMTLVDFARTFQPRGGVYDVTLINPVTQAATPVHFILPDGIPRRVMVEPQGIEFVYGLRHFVRIHFNADGVLVSAR